MINGVLKLKYLNCIYSLAILIIGIPIVCFAANKSEPSHPENFLIAKNDSSTILTKPEKMQKFSPGYVGFNMSMIAELNDLGNYFSERVRWMVDHLPAGALRFPGGTIGNFFDWECMCLDVEAIQNSGHKRMIRNVSVQKKLNQGNLITADFDSYIKLSLEKKIRRFIVLNLFSKDIEDNIRGISKIKRKYPIPFFWELGNELSYYGYRHQLKVDGGWNSQRYIKKARAISEFIRTKYPEDKIGWVISELFNERRLQDHQNTRFEREFSLWDSAVADAKLYDAVIIHPYILYKDEKEWIKIIPPNDRTPQLVNQVKKQLHRMKIRWILANAQEIPQKYVSKITKKFPSKTIWVTETGILGNNKHKSVDYDFTVAKSLFNVAYFLSWLKEYPTIQAYMFHYLGSGKGSHAAFFKDLSFNTNSISYSFIKEALNNAEEIGFIDTTKGPDYYGVARYRETAIKGLSALYIEAADQDRILLVNTSSKPIFLTDLPFDNSEIIYFGGDIQAEIRPGQITAFKDFNRIHTSTNRWQMPQYSIALLKQVN